jgi:hypothetical protein
MNTAAHRYAPPQNTEELLYAWLRRARESQSAHYAMANRLGRAGRWLGVPVIIITATVGTSIFVSIASEVVSVEAKIAVGCLSVVAAVLSGLQTFFKFSERAERHRVFGARYGSARRELESLFAEGTVSREPHYLGLLREKLNRLAEEAPHVPERVFAAAQAGAWVTPGSGQAGFGQTVGGVGGARHLAERHAEAIPPIDADHEVGQVG